MLATWFTIWRGTEGVCTRFGGVQRGSVTHLEGVAPDGRRRPALRRSPCWPRGTQSRAPGGTPCPSLCPPGAPLPGGRSESRSGNWEGNSTRGCDVRKNWWEN
eukprot:1185592-Prorocentrum_minimum.AAC.1